MGPKFLFPCLSLPAHGAHPWPWGIHSRCSSAFPFMAGGAEISARGGAFYPTQSHMPTWGWPVRFTLWLSSFSRVAGNQPQHPCTLILVLILHKADPLWVPAGRMGSRCLGMEQPSEEVTGKPVGEAVPLTSRRSRAWLLNHNSLTGTGGCLWFCHLTPGCWMRLSFCRALGPAQCTHSVPDFRPLGARSRGGVLWSTEGKDRDHPRQSHQRDGPCSQHRDRDSERL